LSPNVVTVIQGVRRCGKTTLLHQIMMAKGIADEDAVFINFEDPRLVGQLDASLLDRIHDISTRGHSRLLTFFLDEIQNVSHWQKWLNTNPGQYRCFATTARGGVTRVLRELPVRQRSHFCDPGNLS
jgi:predicted AAA+ superfamily ATPase